MCNRRAKVMFATMLALCLLRTSPVAAYHSADVERIAAPPGAGLKLLRGYNSRTGQLADMCIKANRTKIERGAGQPGVRDYKLVRSVHEIMSEKNLSIAAELSVGFGIGGASLSVEQSFFKDNSSRVENGAAYAYYLDYEAPVFADSGANYSLTDEAAALYLKSVRGASNAFAKNCGDAVMIGSQAARSFQGIATLARSDSHSEESQSTAVEVAARYIVAELNGSVERGSKTTKDAKELNVDVSYVASGDAKLMGATTIRKFAKVFEEFQRADNTTDIIHIFVIPYEKLLDRSDFDLGISKDRLREVRTIMRGIQRIELARNAARIEASEARSDGARNRAEESRRFLGRELQMLKESFRRADGCLEASVPCDNMNQRLARGASIDKRGEMEEFVGTAISSAKSCSSGYPFSKPNGHAVCAQCRAGEEPVFRDGHEGACGYLAGAPKPAGAKRLFLNDLRKERRTQLEAGVTGTVASFPNFEPKDCEKNCQAKAASAVCEARGLGKAVDFEVWNPLAVDLAGQPHDFFYPNGDRCVPSRAGAFEPVRCKTFKFVDCAGVRTSASKAPPTHSGLRATFQ